MECLRPDQLHTMQRAGRVASRLLKLLARVIKPGISTKDIETFFDKKLAGYPGMSPAFKGYSGYPASICVSINQEVIHGIPKDDVIVSRGDLVSVDLGIEYKGLFVDTATTYAVAGAGLLARRLVKVTKQALFAGIKFARIGNRIGDIGNAIQSLVEKNGFSIVRQFVGHGIGRSLHVPPEIPNFGIRGQGDELKEGQVIAIEPMVCAGDYMVKVLDDGWTARTVDGSLSAHFEHTVAVTKRGPRIITI